MLPGRLRECLTIVRWQEAELTDALATEAAVVRAWLEGRQRPPLAVAAWLEALVKAHLSVPLPAQQSAWSVGSAAAPAKLHGRLGRIAAMEESLDRIAFEEPVEIVVGLGLPTLVDDVMKAYTLLNEWPPSKRSAAHAIALNACRAALVDEVDAETVRATFVAFARRAGILAPKADGVITVQPSGPKGQELRA